MAEMDIGSHCGVPSCQQLDFLPINCDGCGGVFCKEHGSMDTHECDRSRLQSQRACVSGPTSYPCGVDKCTQSSLVPIYCDSCEKPVCIKHKQKELHSCPYLAEFEETKNRWKANEVRQVEQSDKAPKPKKKLNAKQAKLAAKVQLMKLKMKANGDSSIPIPYRTYFVLKDENDDDNQLQVFFASRVPFGKVIDYGSMHFDLPHAQGDKQLRAMSITGFIPDPSMTIEQCVKDEVLLDGDSLKFCYV